MKPDELERTLSRLARVAAGARERIEASVREIGELRQELAQLLGGRRSAGSPAGGAQGNSPTASGAGGPQAHPPREGAPRAGTTGPGSSVSRPESPPARRPAEQAPPTGAEDSTETTGGNPTLTSGALQVELV